MNKFFDHPLFMPLVALLGLAAGLIEVILPMVAYPWYRRRIRQYNSILQEFMSTLGVAKKEAVLTELGVKRAEQVTVDVLRMYMHAWGYTAGKALNGTFERWLYWARPVCKEETLGRLRSFAKDVWRRAQKKRE
jgi:hypothetical protein